jgi:3-oxoacyl-[acyl-carrier protein] reductase
MGQFDRKIAVVTGAGNGIGYAICRQFALEGANIVLNDVNAELARQSADTLNAECGRARVLPYAGDVADVAFDRAMIAAAVAHFGAVDITVANAGITVFGAFLDFEPDTFDRATSVNLRGTYFTAQAGARAMVAAGHGGRIILTSSVVGVQGIPSMSAYGMTKAAIRQMARALAVELGPHGITVNAVAPGATLTDRTATERADYAGDWGALIPTKVVGTPDDVAAAVLFLASPGARQVNGVTLLVDGGWTVTSPGPD